MRLPVLVTSLIYNKEQEQFTTRCLASLSSQNHLLDIRLDSRNCPGKLTQKWNDFCDEFRGTEYDYLVIIANDTLGREETFDHMVRFMEENQEVGIGEVKLNRNLESFLKAPVRYDPSYSVQITDTSNFIIRRGVIEKIGRFNEARFPFAFNERDYIYRAKLANVKVATIEMELFYHPEVSLTLENRGDFYSYRQLYIQLWGGDWQDEVYATPFNSPDLDYTFSEY